MAFGLKKSRERNDEADLKMGRGKRKKRESGYLLLCLEIVIFAYHVVTECSIIHRYTCYKDCNLAVLLFI